MSRRILPMMLILVSLFVVVKVGLNLVQYQHEMSFVDVPLQTSVVKAEAVDDASLLTVEAHHEEVKSVAWGELWIPSAEAAANMPIDEESSDSSNADLKALQAAREQIAIKEKELNEHLDALNKADARVKQRIADLQALESSIQDLLEQENAIKDKKIKRLTAVYEGMKPEKAAAVISQMELVTVVKMFSKMNEKKVGKILSFLKPDQAMKISQALTKGIAALSR